MLADTAILSVWDVLSEMIRAGGAPPKGTKGEPLFAPRRVYRGRTPPELQTVPLGYVLLWAPLSEDESSFYEEEGNEGLYRGGCWSDSPDNALKMYRWLKRLVHGETPAMEDHVLWQPFQVRYVTMAPGPKDTSHQVIFDVFAATDRG